MKFVFTLATAFAVISCKPKPETTTEDQPVTEEQVRALKKEQAALLNRKLSIEKRLNQLVATNKTDPDGTMQLVLKEREQAFTDLNKIRNTHPSLQKINEDLLFWKNNAASARLGNRQFEIEQASKKISELTGKLQNLTRELPAIREAEDQISRCDQQLTSLRRELAEKTPEGRTLVEELEEIERKLQSK